MSSIWKCRGWEVIWIDRHHQMLLLSTYSVFICLGVTGDCPPSVAEHKRIISLEEFPSYVEEMHRDRDQGYEEEYKVSPTLIQHTGTVCGTSRGEGGQSKTSTLCFIHIFIVWLSMYLSPCIQLFRTDLVNTAKAALDFPVKNRYGNIFACRSPPLCSHDRPCVYTQ